jgi:hypothetical protein
MHYLRREQKQPANDSVILGMLTEEINQKFEELKGLSFLTFCLARVSQLMSLKKGCRLTYNETNINQVYH